MIRKAYLISFIVTTVLIALIAIPSIQAIEYDTKEINKKTIEQSCTYTATEQSERHTFEKAIEYKGKKYKLSGSSSETISESPETERKDLTETVTIGNLKNRSVNELLTKTYNGTEFTLNLSKADYQEIASESETHTVTGTVDYGFSTTTPSASQSQTISYEENGVKREATATFNGFTMSDARWQDGYTLTARFIGDEDVRFYDFSGTQIPNTGNGVPYQGYESIILGSLGLDTQNIRIDNAVWNTTATENGQHVRYATLNCSRYGRDYVANYSAIVPRYLYTATATYTLKNADVPTGNTLYSIYATATYEQKGLSAQIIMGTALLLILFFVGLLFLLKRRKEKKQ